MSLRAYYSVFHHLSQLNMKYFKVNYVPSSVKAEANIIEWKQQKWFEYIEHIYREFLFGDQNVSKYFQHDQKQKFYSLSKTLYENMQHCLEENCSYVTYCDSYYPPNLRFLDDCPYGLFAMGDLRTLDDPCFSIVGSRKSNPFAINQSRDLGMLLAQRGYTIVSGGAFGCDIAAHLGVLAANLQPVPAIVVYAGGLDCIYPRGNARVFDEIKEKNGIFLTEKLWMTEVKPYYFPIRNRIISGISKVTIVIDASLKSGALNTARNALDQGREVWVLKPQNHSLTSEGIEHLILDGALSFNNAYDLLNNYDLDHFIRG
jgi:DNA processing protein